ncbi:uncharacterized protein PGTG_11482 [Puccinia graminis f. sp. tritici CRL 75-36-700-3]|uniref:Uncharacterized protein n=1 Tax=Puccinia graminis f. sp. tritici (strain CRL 75-36-700-3 / race SCCL) TaxID=418459 RepID=E3KLW4_PUCGT|nr:uncharacterized protein PGTG_11482 [Puccinia graminis f. sp. tritici CRL 75-36-700-3]EFP85313.1 hypothetical protein PGTG_11482 [Puccinia graminis f. sp. tritici CRL 75-36-700-3]
MIIPNENGNASVARIFTTEHSQLQKCSGAKPDPGVRRDAQSASLASPPDLAEGIRYSSTVPPGENLICHLAPGFRLHTSFAWRLMPFVTKGLSKDQGRKRYEGMSEEALLQQGIGGY